MAKRKKRNADPTFDSSKIVLAHGNGFVESISPDIYTRNLFELFVQEEITARRKYCPSITRSMVR